MKNLIQIKNKAPRLTAGQKALMDLVCSKTKENGIIESDDVLNIYISHVQQFKQIRIGEGVDGVGWLEDKMKRCPEYVRWESGQWLNRNLGILITKGYLKVVPITYLSKINKVEYLKNGE